MIRHPPRVLLSSAVVSSSLIKQCKINLLYQDQQRPPCAHLRASINLCFCVPIKAQQPDPPQCFKVESTSVRSFVYSCSALCQIVESKVDGPMFLQFGLVRCRCLRSINIILKRESSDFVAMSYLGQISRERSRECALNCFACS